MKPNKSDEPTFQNYLNKDAMIVELKSIQFSKKYEVDFSVKIHYLLVLKQIETFNKEELKHTKPISWTRYFNYYMGFSKSLHKHFI